MLKDKGFVSASYDLYGGFSHLLDYGPLGVLLKRNVTRLWWHHFVTLRDDVFGMDTPILSPEPLWRAAGHLSHFTDPLVQCVSCRHIFRADHLVESTSTPTTPTIPSTSSTNSACMSADELQIALSEHPPRCPHCGKQEWGEVRATNLMFRTQVGPQQQHSVTGYLRPETAQGLFINYGSVARCMRRAPPFGLAQIGKAFRNELDPGGFLFRLREFEQMELEYFCHPAASDACYRQWVDRCHGFLTGVLGLDASSLRLREHAPGESAHYARATTDIEYRYTFGWKELWGVANRTDYDLRQHAAATGAHSSLSCRDPVSGDTFVPHVVEPSVGLDRLVYALLTDAYRHDDQGTGRSVLALRPSLSPYLFAVLPLLKDPRMVALAARLRADFLLPLSSGRAVDLDVPGTVGRRYRRQDQIGTPFCAVIDHQSLEDNSFTIRFRDSMQQVRLSMDPTTIFRFLQEQNV